MRLHQWIYFAILSVCLSCFVSFAEAETKNFSSCSNSSNPDAINVNIADAVQINPIKTVDVQFPATQTELFNATLQHNNISADLMLGEACLGDIKDLGCDTTQLTNFTTLSGEELNGIWTLTSNEVDLTGWCLELGYESIPPALAKYEDSLETNKLIYFGAIPYGDKQDQSFTITNTGEAKLEIKLENISSPLFYFVVPTLSPGETFSIEPGQSKALTLTYNAPMEAALNTAVLTLRTNDNTNSSVAINLKGISQAAKYSSVPPPGETPITMEAFFGQTVSKTIKIINDVDPTIGKALLVTVDSLTNPDVFSAINAPPYDVNILPKAEHVITVYCSPPADGNQDKTYRATLTLNTDALNLSHPIYTIECKGKKPPTPVYDAIPQAPGPIDFGDVSVGTTSGTQSIAINNSGGAELIITIIPIDNDDFIITAPSASEPLTIASGQSKEIAMACRPSASGPTNATLKLATNQPAGQSANAFITKTYVLKCRGLTPKYHPEPRKIDFGNSLVNKEVTRTFDIENKGNGALEIKFVNFGGTHSQDFGFASNPFPINLPGDSNEKKTITLTCTPSGEGERKAILNLSSNDTSHQNISYELTCSGRVGAPIYDANHQPGSAMTFHPTPTGTPVYETLNITNKGEGNLIINLGNPAFANFKNASAHLEDFNLVDPPNFPLNISPGEQQALTIACNPLAQGVHKVEFNLSSNAIENINYKLICNGKLPAPLDVIEFGDTPVGKPKEVVFKMQETDHKKDITINKVWPETITGEKASDFSIQQPSFPIVLSKDTKTLELVLRCTPSSVGMRTATLLLASNEPSKPLRSFTLKCTGTATQPVYNSEPTQDEPILFGSSFVNTVIVKTIAINNLGDTPLAVTVTGIENDQNNVFKLIDPPISFILTKNDEPEQLTIQCRPLSMGRHTSTLKLKTNDTKYPNGIVSYPLECEGTDIVSAGYHSTPIAPGGTFDLGAHPVGVTVENHLHIEEVGNADLQVSIETTEAMLGDVFSLVDVPNSFTIKDEDELQIITVQCTPPSVGTHTTTLSLISNDPKQLHIDYTLKCSGIAGAMTQLMLSLGGDGQGHVKVEPPNTLCQEGNCTYTYETGDVVVLTPIAATGSTFSHWGGDDACGQNPLTLTEEKSCTAYFRLLPTDLTVTIVGHGQVTSQPQGVQCNGDDERCVYGYAGQSTVVLKAEPESGWIFADWQGDCDETGKVIMTTEKSCQAIFTPLSADEALLNIEKTGTGEGTVTSQPAGIDCGTGCRHVYPKGTLITLIASPKAGSLFSHWSQCSQSQENRITINLEQANTCVAHFKQLPTPPTGSHGLVTNKIGQGTVVSEPAGITCHPTCYAYYPGGTALTLRAIPSAGFAFAGFSGHCDDQGQVLLDDDKSCTVYFEPATTPASQEKPLFILETETQGPGQIIGEGIECGGDCMENYGHETAVTLTAIPQLGAQFIRWRGDCGGTAETIEITLDKLKVCAADFEWLAVDSYTLTLDKIGAGTITSEPPGIDCNETCQVRFPAQTQVMLNTSTTASFSGDCDDTGQVVMTEDRFCQVIFAEEEPAAGYLQFSQPEWVVNEHAALLQMHITRTVGSEGVVTVDYASQDDSALAGEDYTAIQGTLQWDNGETEAKTLTLAIREDQAIESRESFFLQLANPTGGAQLGVDKLAQVIINDDDLLGCEVNSTGIDETGVSLANTRSCFNIKLAAETVVQANHSELTHQQAKEITISGRITVAPEHVGQPADLLMVITYKTETFTLDLMRTADNRWLPWENKAIDQLITAGHIAQLPESIENIEIYHGDASQTPAEFLVMLGYRLSNSRIIYSGLDPLHFYVGENPAACIVYGVHDAAIRDTQFVQINLSAEGQDVMVPLGLLHPGLDIEGLSLMPTQPHQVYGTSGHESLVDGEPKGGLLYAINRYTGELKTVGWTGYHKVSALAIHPQEGILWGWGVNQEKQWSGLITIDPITAEGQPVQAFKYGRHNMEALAWDPQGDRLYAAKGSSLWVYDKAARTFEIACRKVAEGNIEALDMQPNGLLLMGIDNQAGMAVINVYDPEQCTIVNQKIFKNLAYDDIESLVWPPGECGNQAWMAR